MAVTLPNNQGPQSKGETRHPSEEAHFHHLHSHSIGHYPQLVAIDKVGNVN